MSLEWGDIRPTIDGQRDAIEGLARTLYDVVSSLIGNVPLSAATIEWHATTGEAIKRADEWKARK